MTLSYHAAKRLQQRGVSEKDLEIVFFYGIQRYRGGAIEHVITEKSAALAIAEDPSIRKNIERLINVSFVYQGGTVLTVQHSYKKWRRP